MRILRTNLTGAPSMSFLLLGCEAYSLAAVPQAHVATRAAVTMSGWAPLASTPDFRFGTGAKTGGPFANRNIYGGADCISVTGSVAPTAETMAEAPSEEPEVTEPVEEFEDVHPITPLCPVHWQRVHSVRIACKGIMEENLLQELFVPLFPHPDPRNLQRQIRK